MTLLFEALTENGAEAARRWRNESLETLRTPFPLTVEQQKAFYQSLQERNSPHRYWQLSEDYIVGVVGLTNIDYINGHAEISLIISPNKRGRGIGKEAVRLVLDQAFNYMRLMTVYGEVYKCNRGIEFWEKVISLYRGYTTMLPDRKLWKGMYYGSLYFSIGAMDHMSRCSSAGGSDRFNQPISTHS
jgi:hypothetical protein